MGALQRVRRAGAAPTRRAAGDRTGSCVTRVAAYQLSPRIGDLEYNLRLSTDAIRTSVEAGARVVILPELVTSGYVFASREEAASVAVAADHPLFDSWADEAAR